MKYFSLLFVMIVSSFCFADLTAPSNQGELTFTHILFEWDQEPDAVGYNIQSSLLSDFNNLIIDTNVGSTVYIDTENFEWNDNYYWRVRSIYNNEDEDYNLGEWIDTSSFSIGNIQFPERTPDIINENLMQEGLIAFGGFAPNLSSAVIDKYGNEIWNNRLGEGFIINHINEYGNIYGLSGDDHPNNTGTKINYDGEFLWSAPTTDPAFAVDIHEIKQIPNGNYMAFVPDYQLGPIPEGPWSFYYQLSGYQADGVTNEYPWIGMRIVEWDEDGNEVWNWDPFEHFTMDDTDLYGGTWWNLTTGTHDWMHSNAFHFDQEESVIYVSHRHLSRISKIAYPSGDVIWNIGMPEEYNTGSDNICTDLGNSFQHNIQLLEDGSLLFFDNGNLSPMLMGDENPISRLRRIRVIDNSYCETEWEYELPPDLFGLGMGSVQLQENGNYLLYTFGSGLSQVQPTLREVSPSHEVVWNYQGSPNAAWYRTYKIPSIHPNAFSVVADDYTISEEGENTIELSTNTLDFTIYNKSGYALEYKYMLSDLMDGGTQLFIYNEGTVDIQPYGSANLSFSVNSEADISETQVMLGIWPNHHEYAAKELIFPVSIGSSLIGDINSDGSINVIDVVLAVNIVLSQSYDLSADLNNDDVVNVIDIVLLVNLILD